MIGTAIILAAVGTGRHMAAERMRVDGPNAPFSVGTSENRRIHTEQTRFLTRGAREIDNSNNAPATRQQTVAGEERWLVGCGQDAQGFKTTSDGGRRGGKG